MTFHESYGLLRQSTLRLIRQFNVSPADYDSILSVFNWTWDRSTDIDFDVVDSFIRAGSQSGIYRPSRYL